MPTNPSPSDRLDAEAAAWAARKRDGLDKQGLADLQAWLDAGEGRAAAIAGMEATFASLRQLPAAEVAALRRGLREKQAAHAPVRRRFISGWGSLFPQAAVAALVLSVVGAGWLGWDHWSGLPTFEQTYASARGQQLRVTLPDAGGAGSTVQLDTATTLEAHLFRNRREVYLKDGEAMFVVQTDKDRPFHVWAGRLHITVVGTRFSVRHTTTGLNAGQTVVSVEEGRVRVTPADTHEATTHTQQVELTAGQTIAGDDNGRMGAVTRTSPAALAQWRSGRISFDNTPLALALAEFERYGGTGVVVNDPAVAALPVGGSYGVQQMRRFAEALPQVLPVRLVQRGDVTEIIAR